MLSLLTKNMPSTTSDPVEISEAKQIKQRYFVADLARSLYRS